MASLLLVAMPFVPSSVLAPILPLDAEAKKFVTVGSLFTLICLAGLIYGRLSMRRGNKHGHSDPLSDLTCGKKRAMVGRLKRYG